ESATAFACLIESRSAFVVVTHTELIGPPCGLGAAGLGGGAAWAVDACAAAPDVVACAVVAAAPRVLSGFACALSATAPPSIASAPGNAADLAGALPCVLRLDGERTAPSAPLARFGAVPPPGATMTPAATGTLFWIAAIC